jgi:membrane protein
VKWRKKRVAPLEGERRLGRPPASAVGNAVSRAERSVYRNARASAGDFLRRVLKKAEQDNIFFLAGAIAFNVIVAIVPLALASIGVAGFFLRARGDQVSPAEPVVQYLIGVLPEVSLEFETAMRDMLNGFVQKSSGLFTAGTLVFAWLATRLIGTLRSALREVFDLQSDRSIIAGKIFDMQMVFVAGTLLAVNITVTVLLKLIAEDALDYLNVGAGQTKWWNSMLLVFLSFFTIWFMFALIYRYLPARQIQWRTAIIAATFTAVLFELMKKGFGWFFATRGTMSTYDSLASIAIVVLWVYYMAVAFVLGGEVGQVAALQQIRRRQKERLS